MTTQPSTAQPDSYYYLPISYDTVQNLLQGLTGPGSLGIPELAAVLVLQSLPELSDAVGRIEVGLSKAIRMGQNIGQEALAEAVAQRLQLDKLQAGLDGVQDLPLYLLEQEDVDSASYLNSKREWDFAYRIRKAADNVSLGEHVFNREGNPIPVTGQQQRLLNQIRVDLDEHVHFQGLAGVGKTTMIRILMELLQPTTTLLLAQTRQQLDELVARLGAQECHAMTFAQLASQLLYTPPTQHAAPGQRRSLAYQVSDAQVAVFLGLTEVAGMPAARVAQICRRTVASYCYTKNERLCESNLPSLDVALDAADRAALLGYSQKLWDETIRPTARVEGQLHGLPIRAYHMLKLLSLDQEITLGLARFTHIVIDEAHNLPAPFVQFLDRCPQAICTLGDTYQRLDGMAATRRGSHVRQRELTQSVRSGPQMESVLNPLIEAAPAEALPLIGAKDKKTLIQHYEQPEIPEDGTTILVNTEWGMFEWFQRLAFAGAKFGLLAASAISFARFVHDCIDLYRRNIPPNHPLIFRYQSWEGLTKAYANNPSFKRVENMLQRGYTGADFQQALAKTSSAGNATIFLGKVADARSAELGKVMLGSDLLTRHHSGNTGAAMRAIATLYVGSSRACNKLIIPGHWQGWLQDLVAHSKQ